MITTVLATYSIQEKSFYSNFNFLKLDLLCLATVGKFSLPQ